MPRRALVVALGAALALSGCTGPAPMPTPTPTVPTPSGDGVLRIGTLFSTTGPDAGEAASQTAAVNAAIRELDAAGGVDGAPVEVINRNGGAAGDGAAEAAFADLLARGVDAIIGPSSAEIAAIVAPLAAAAHVPLLSGSAAGDRPAGSEGWYFRSIPSLTAQAAALAGMIGDGQTIAVLRSDDAVGQAWAAGMGDAVVADVVLSGDAVADAAQLTGADPDAVVIVTADASEQTGAVIAALAGAGVAGEAIWIAGRSLGGYSSVGAALDGAHGITTGVSADEGFLARVRQEDPGVPSLRFAAEAYDATVLVALAAVQAGDDGGASIAATLPRVLDGGIPCTSVGACLDVLTTEPAVAYRGPSGAFAFENGDRVGADYLRYVYDATGTPAVADTVSG